MQPLHVSQHLHVPRRSRVGTSTWRHRRLATASLMTPTLNRRARAQVRFTGYPFTLGVASGCPQPDSGALDAARSRTLHWGRHGAWAGGSALKSHTTNTFTPQCRKVACGQPRNSGIVCT